VDGSNDKTRVVLKETVSGTGYSLGGGKGKEVKQEKKISNLVHVSGFEVHHGTGLLNL